MAGLKETLSLCLIYIFTCLTAVKGDTTCGDGEFITTCLGWTAHCCSFDSSQCCFYQFYSFWWFWFIWVMVFLTCASCGYCCRRRYVQRRYAEGVVVIDQTAGQGYGTVNQGYVQAPVGYAQPPAYNGQLTGPVPNAPVEPQKPPQYEQQGKPPAYTAQP